MSACSAWPAFFVSVGCAALLEHPDVIILRRSCRRPMGWHV